MNIHIKSVFENVIVDDKDKQIEEKDKYIKALKEDIETYRIQSNYFIDRSDDLEKEVDRLNNIINELEKDIKERYHREIDYQTKIRQMDLMQGDYPVSYYYSNQNEKLLGYYLERIKELKEGNDKC